MLFVTKLGKFATMADLASYDIVIGLEIHVQLQTQTKVFSPEGYTTDEEPNGSISPVTLAHPGALPVTNHQIIAHAVKIGLATQCTINSPTQFARKNYFYPDLPKGYQISQAERPICEDGLITFPDEHGRLKTVSLERIHIEEDAGKSIHDQDPTYSWVDLNRAGTGLVEMVTRPELTSAADAAALVAEVRRTVRYLGISDANMEKGNLRCDANVSLKPKGRVKLGTRVEIKNLNSFSNLTKAIEVETLRQAQILDEGGSITQETRTFDVERKRTLQMRDKETADDYRYFPEPDLLPVVISEDTLSATQASLPTLPYKRFEDYFTQVGLPYNEAIFLAEEVGLSDYFEAVRALVKDDKLVANWVLGPVNAHLQTAAIDIDQFPIPAGSLAAMLQLHQNGLSNHLTREQLFPAMLAEPKQAPKALAQKMGLLDDQSDDEMLATIQEILQNHPKELDRYQKGQKKLMGFFVGQVMRALKGKGDPKQVNQLVKQALNQR